MLRLQAVIPLDLSICHLILLGLYAVNCHLPTGCLAHHLPPDLATIMHVFPCSDAHLMIVGVS